MILNQFLIRHKFSKVNFASSGKREFHHPQKVKIKYFGCKRQLVQWSEHMLALRKVRVQGVLLRTSQHPLCQPGSKQVLVIKLGKKKDEERNQLLFLTMTYLRVVPLYHSAPQRSFRVYKRLEFPSSWVQLAIILNISRDLNHTLDALQ